MQVATLHEDQKAYVDPHQVATLVGEAGMMVIKLMVNVAMITEVRW